MLPKIIVDLILTAFIITGVVVGLKRGFIKTILKPVRFLGAFGIAVGCAEGFGRSVISPIISQPIINKVSAHLYQYCPNITQATAEEELPTLLKVAAAVVGVDVNNMSSEQSQEFIQTVVATLAEPVVNVISLIFAFFALFFLSKLLITVAFLIINKFFDKGILGVPNKILGCVFCTLFAFTVSWLFTMVFDFVIHTSAFANVSWAYGFEGGIVYKLFNELSPIELLLSF